jgi:hypothetical protein
MTLAHLRVQIRHFVEYIQFVFGFHSYNRAMWFWEGRITSRSTFSHSIKDTENQNDFQW